VDTAADFSITTGENDIFLQNQSRPRDALIFFDRAQRDGGLTNM
jgi:hypothetical protein|tara:strand:+ start:503 stop:634 length:132 start_codon:yes stop_codon:yes gene_type:complete